MGSSGKKKFIGVRGGCGKGTKSSPPGGKSSTCFVSGFIHRLCEMSLMRQWYIFVCVIFVITRQFIATAVPHGE